MNTGAINSISVTVISRYIFFNVFVALSLDVSMHDFEGGKAR